MQDVQTTAETVSGTIGANQSNHMVERIVKQICFDVCKRRNDSKFKLTMSRLLKPLGWNNQKCVNWMHANEMETHVFWCGGGQGCIFLMTSDSHRE